MEAKSQLGGFAWGTGWRELRGAPQGARRDCNALHALIGWL